MLKLFFILFSSLFALEIEIGKETLNVEIARTNEARTKGLSGRVELPEGTGMLFVYERPQIGYFWMKDTLIALSIGFFDANRTLIGVKDMPIPPPKAEKFSIYSSPRPISYALEVPEGWFRKHGIEIGTKFQIKRVTAPEIFKNSSADPSNLQK